MSIESNIFDALKTLVTNRVYPDIAPLNVTKPYITYQQIGGLGVNFLDPTTPSKKNGRFQVNVWGVSRASVATLARQVEDTLRTTVGIQTTVSGAPVAVYEQDTQLFGSRQDFSFWHST